MAGDEELPSLNDDWDPVDDEWGANFLVPPPPPPPPSSLGSVCTASDFFCQVEGGPMGAHFNKASFPSLPIIAVCSSVVLVAVLVATFLLWRHKTKVQNLLPCKNEQQGHLGELGAANGITYEDVLINRHPTRIPQGHLTGSQTLMPLEILDVKLGDISVPSLSSLHHTPCYPARDVSGHVVMGGKPFNPVYEEVSQAPSADKSKSYETDFGEDSGKLGGRSLTSEDDFGEDFEVGSGGQCSATSSVRGSTGGDLCKDPVSSDEGNGEDCDCDYMVNDNNMPSDNSFGYPPRLLHLDMNRPTEKQQPRRNHPSMQQAPSSRGHPHNTTTYPLPERTNYLPPPSHRGAEGRSKVHSKQPDSSSKRPPPSTFAPPPQWYPEDRMGGFPASASQENIYSTIDEEELPDYPVAATHPPLPSLACSQRGSPADNKLGCSAVPPKGRSGDTRAIPPLSQRNTTEENGSSYGDMMPAFHSASFM